MSAESRSAFRQFSVLWRAFFAQFFTSETVTSDVHLHQAIAWALAFLLAVNVRVLFSTLRTIWQ